MAKSNPENSRREVGGAVLGWGRLGGRLAQRCGCGQSPGLLGGGGIYPGEEVSKQSAQHLRRHGGLEDRRPVSQRKLAAKDHNQKLLESNQHI